MLWFGFCEIFYLTKQYFFPCSPYLATNALLNNFTFLQISTLLIYNLWLSKSFKVVGIITLNLFHFQNTTVFKSLPYSAFLEFCFFLICSHLLGGPNCKAHPLKLASLWDLPDKSFLPLFLILLKIRDAKL